MKLLIAMAVTGATLMAATAIAGPIDGRMMVTFDIEETPSTVCPGFFGTNPDSNAFSDCAVQDKDGNQLSPVIVKYDFESDGIKSEVSEYYPDFSADSIVLEDSSWMYNRGDGDPGIRYWAAKGGTSFNLFWYVDPTVVGEGKVCDADSPYSLACLNQALVVSEGTWTTPDNKGLSNLVFFNTDGNDVPVPEPGTAALLFSGLIGLFMARRRQRSLQA